MEVYTYIYTFICRHIYTHTTHSIRDFNKMEEQQLEQKSKFTQTPSYLPSEFTNILKKNRERYQDIGSTIALYVGKKIFLKREKNKLGKYILNV